MNTLQKLNEVFQITFKDPSIEVQREHTANDIEGWDSITHLDLIVAVEKHFNLEINGFEIMGLKNVGDLADLIDKKVA